MRPAASHATSVLLDIERHLGAHGVVEPAGISSSPRKRAHDGGLDATDVEHQDFAQSLARLSRESAAVLHKFQSLERLRTSRSATQHAPPQQATPSAAKPHAPRRLLAAQGQNEAVAGIRTSSVSSVGSCALSPVHRRLAEGTGGHEHSTGVSNSEYSSPRARQESRIVRRLTAETMSPRARAWAGAPRPSASNFSVRRRATWDVAIPQFPAQPATQSPAAAPCPPAGAPPAGRAPLPPSGATPRLSPSAASGASTPAAAQPRSSDDRHLLRAPSPAALTQPPWPGSTRRTAGAGPGERSSGGAPAAESQPPSVWDAVGGERLSQRPDPNQLMELQLPRMTAEHIDDLLQEIERRTAGCWDAAPEAATPTSASASDPSTALAGHRPPRWTSDGAAQSPPPVGRGNEDVARAFGGHSALPWPQPPFFDHDLSAPRAPPSDSDVQYTLHHFVGGERALHPSPPPGKSAPGRDESSPAHVAVPASSPARWTAVSASPSARWEHDEVHGTSSLVGGASPPLQDAVRHQSGSPAAVPRGAPTETRAYVERQAEYTLVDPTGWGEAGDYRGRPQASSADAQAGRPAAVDVRVMGKQLAQAYLEAFARNGCRSNGNAPARTSRTSAGEGTEHSGDEVADLTTSISLLNICAAGDMPFLVLACVQGIQSVLANQEEITVLDLGHAVARAVAHHLQCTK